MAKYKHILLGCRLIDDLKRRKIPYSIDTDCNGFFEVETHTDESIWFRFYDNELKLIKWNKKGDNSQDWKTYTYKELDEGKYKDIENLLEQQRVDGEAPYTDYKDKIAVILDTAQFLSENNIPFETISAVNERDGFGRATLGSIFNDNFWIDFFESGFSVYERVPDKENIEEYIDRRKNLIGFTYTEFLKYEPNHPYINKTKIDFFTTIKNLQSGTNKTMKLQNNDKVIIKKTYLNGFTEFFVATILQDEHCLEDELYYYAPDLDNPHARYGSIHDLGIEIIKKIKK